MLIVTSAADINFRYAELAFFMPNGREELIKEPFVHKITTYMESTHANI